MSNLSQISLCVPRSLGTRTIKDETLEDARLARKDSTPRTGKSGRVDADETIGPVIGPRGARADSQFGKHFSESKSVKRTRLSPIFAQKTHCTSLHL